MADPQDLLLGQLAVKKGLISSQQLAAALGKQEELRAVGRKQPLGEILEAEGLVDRPAIQELLRSQAKSAVRELGGFELISRLGAGGMGTVYKARQKSMDRIVALKVLPPRLARDRIFIERFFREARAVARLNHSNIVQGIDVGEASGYYYFAMEFVEGRSLRDLLEQKGRFSEQEALDFVEQMARALDHAHKNGLIHRDVKPDNVLVDKTGVAKLCDLGLSRSSQEDASLTQTGVAMGTPHYIAPEQARAEKDVDGRADLYSLGATWFHLLAGAPPFTADSAMAIVAKHLTEAAPSVRTVRPDVSAATASAVSRLMAKERAERYQSAEELLKDIADLRAGRMPAVAASGFSGEITVAAPPKPAAPPRVRDTRAYPPVDLPEVVPVARGGRTAPTLPVSAPGAGAGGGAVKLALAAGVLLAAVLVGWVIKRNIAGPAEDPGSRPPISETGPATTQNPTANPGTGPATGAKPTPDRMGQLEDMHQYVLKTTGEKPDDLALLTSQWEQLRDAGKGTKYQLMADEELRKLAVRREELDRRRFEPVRAKLDDLERRVDGHLAARRFGEARDALKEFALDPGAPGDLVRRLADLNARSDSAGNTAVKTVADDALRFAEGGRFPEARKTLDALTAFGLPAAAEAHRSTSVRIGELERDAARRRDEEARRRCEQVLSRVGPRVESRDFAGALAEIDKVSKGLPDDVAGQVRAERAIVAAAAGFMERCRERAAAQPVGVRLVYKGISAPLKSYDPGTETLTLGEGGASFPARLAELEPEQLLVLAGSREPAKLPAAEALAALNQDAADGDVNLQAILEKFGATSEKAAEFAASAKAVADENQRLAEQTGKISEKAGSAAETLGSLDKAYEGNAKAAENTRKATDDYIAKLDDLKWRIEALNGKKATGTVNVVQNGSLPATPKPKPEPGESGYASGVDFTVPAGYPHDSYPIKAQSGERVIILPAGERNSRGVGGLTLYGNLTIVQQGGDVRDTLSSLSRA